MSYKDFLKQITEQNIYYYPGHTKKEIRNCDKGEYIEVSWIIGGMTGGSCWDTSASKHRPVLAKPEPEFDCLDKILEILCPQITFLQYKDIIKNCIKYDDQEILEYYGNRTEYRYKTIFLKELYDRLIEKGLLI
jgi:hypothetical protein